MSFKGKSFKGGIQKQTLVQKRHFFRSKILKIIVLKEKTSPKRKHVKSAKMNVFKRKVFEMMVFKKYVFNQK
jgi:hypothetical protein